MLKKIFKDKRIIFKGRKLNLGIVKIGACIIKLDDRKDLERLNMKALLKANLLYLSINFLNASTAFILIPFYLNHFTVEQYGLLALMNSFFSLLTIFVTLNLSYSFQTFYFDFERNTEELYDFLRQIYTFSILCAILFLIVITITGPSLFEAIFANNVINFFPHGLLVACNACLSGVNQIYYVFLHNEEKLKRYATLMSVSTLINLILQIILIGGFKFDITGVFLSTMFSNLSVLLIINFRVRLLTTTINWRILNGAIRYAAWSLPFFFIKWFSAKGDRFVIERLISLEQVGVYALLTNISMIISLIATSYLNSIRPALFKGFIEMNKLLSSITLRLFLLFLSIVVGTALTIFLVVQQIDFFEIDPIYLRIKSYIIPALILFILEVTIRFFSEYFTFRKKSRDLTIFSLLNFTLYIVLLYLQKDDLTLNSMLQILIATNVMSLILLTGRAFYINKEYIN